MKHFFTQCLQYASSILTVYNVYSIVAGLLQCKLLNSELERALLPSMFTHTRNLSVAGASSGEESTNNMLTYRN